MLGLMRSVALEVADKQHSRMPIYRSRVDDVIGLHERRGGVGDVEQADIAEIHRRRSAHEADWIDDHFGAIDGNRLDHPHMNIEAHYRRVRIDQ